MNKLLLLAATTLSCFSLANAEEIKKSPLAEVKALQESILPIKFIGVLDFEPITFIQNDAADQNKSGFNQNFAIKTSGAIAAIFEKNLTETFKYGAKITLKTTTLPKSSSKFNGSHIYVKDTWGKVTLGCDYDAMASSSVTGLDAAVAKYGASVYGVSNEVTENSKTVKIPVSPYYSFILDTTLRAGAFDEGSSTEPARKLVYYSPKLLDGGLKLVASYTPDSSNCGILKNATKKIKYNQLKGANNTTATATATDEVYGIPFVAINVFSGAVVYEKQINPDLAFQIGLSAEAGQAVQKYQTGKIDKSKSKSKTTWDDELEDAKVNNIFSWNLGAKVTYNNLAFAASYADLGNAFGLDKTSDIFKLILEAEQKLQDKKTTYLAASMGYTIGEYGVSVSAFKSDTKGAPFNFVALGGDYKPSTNLKFYGEIAYAWFNDGSDNAVKHNGTAISVGTVVNF